MDALLGVRGRAFAVVGAGRGIGRSAVLLLARCGCRLALVDLAADRLGAVAEEARGLGALAHGFEADVTEEPRAQAAVAQAAEALGGLDGLVNIVGMAGWGELLELDAESWERELRLNLTQHFYVARAFARQCIQRGGGGSVVTVASVSGLLAAPRHGAYGAAKAGLVALTRTMAEEWRPHGIRVNSVAPGSVRTPRIEALRAAGELPTPPPDELARMAEPEDVAGAILFLSSDLARRVTGQTLVVDGGASIRFPFTIG